jgi:threonine dehydratase
MIMPLEYQEKVHGAFMVELEDIEAAAERIAPLIARTPLLENPVVNERLQGRLLIKAENLQKTGSFKIRGASSRISKMSDQERDRGVVAYSSGNHAQGVALAAKHFGVAAVIVMPEDAPKAKIEGTRSHGAKVVLYDRVRESREEIAANIAKETGAILVPPYEDPYIIAGQGSCGLEIALQAKAIKAELDLFITPTSGGGLASGCGIALKALSPETSLMVAEPEGFDDMMRSLAQGERCENEAGAKSICDALLLPTPGKIAFSIMKGLGYSGLMVSDHEVRAAMGVAFRDYKIVVEPGGAVALAAILSGKVDMKGKTVCVITTGGNVDAKMFSEIITAGA